MSLDLAPAGSLANEEADSHGPTDSLVALPKVMAAFGIGRSTVYEKIKRGEFPPPVKHGRSSRWSTLELMRHMEELRRARRG